MAAKFVKSDKLSRAERLRQKNSGKQSPFAETFRPQDEDEEEFTPQKSSSMHAAKPKTTPGSNVFARPIAANNEPTTAKTKRQPTHQMGSQRNASRRITLPMNKQGAEIQFSTLPFTRFGWRAVSGILAITCLVALIFLSQQKVTSIQFVGVQDSLANDIKAVLNLDGSPIYSIDPQLVSMKMDNAFPKLTDVKVKIQLPKKVIVSAKERTPVYAWKMDTFIYLIDNENLIYPASLTDDYSGLVLISANILPPEVSIIESSNDIITDIMDDLYPDPDAEKAVAGAAIHKNTYTVDGKTIATLKQLISYLPAEATLIYSKDHGFGWQASQGWATYFGNDLEDMDMKLAIARAIEQNLALNNIEATMISVEYVHAPYYREE